MASKKSGKRRKYGQNKAVKSQRSRRFREMCNISGVLEKGYKKEATGESSTRSRVESSGSTEDGNIEIGMMVKTEIPEEDVEGDACSDCECSSICIQAPAQDRHSVSCQALQKTAPSSDCRHNGPSTQEEVTSRGPCTDCALRTQHLQEEHHFRLKNLAEEHKLRMQNLDLEHQVLCFMKTNILIKRKFLLSRFKQKLTRSAAAQLEMTMETTVDNSGTGNIDMLP